MHAGHCQRMMCGQDDGAAMGNALGQKLLKPPHALKIYGGEGFVENPQGLVGYQQAGKSHPALLARRQVLAWQVVKPREARAVQRSPEVFIRMRLASGHQRSQVLKRGKQLFDTGTMANIEKIAQEFLTPAGTKMIAPENIAAETVVEACQYAQQGGLTRAIRALDTGQGPGHYGHIQALEQEAVVALAVHIDSL
jgi:hypothetical protein